MKKALFIFILFVSCSSPDSASEELQPEIFKSKIDDGATVLDVRTPEEYSTGHIAGSQNIDFKDSSFETKILTFDKARPYAVYCASGVRSGKAAEIMKQHGFANVFTLAGGLKTWKEKGLPVE